MSTQNNTSQEKKEIAKPDDKNKKELSWGEKLAEQIAGDNEMLKNAIKFVTHPLMMFGGLLAFFYWLFKDKGQKEAIDKLKSRNKKMREHLEGLEKKFEELKTEQEKLKEEFQKGKEENMSGLGVIPNQNKNNKTKRYHSSYLD